jgi:hypothetical protein
MARPRQGSEIQDVELFDLFCGGPNLKRVARRAINLLLVDVRRCQVPKPIHICEVCSKKKGGCSLTKIHQTFIDSGEMQTVLCPAYVISKTK